jgi:hypothetical protein
MNLTSFFGNFFSLGFRVATHNEGIAIVLEGPAMCPM